jgi:archaellum component FlaC
LGDYKDALEKMAKAKAAAEMDDAAAQGMADAVKVQVDAQNKLNELYDQSTAALKRKQDAEKIYNRDYGNLTGFEALLSRLTPQYKELQAAREEYDDITDRIEDSRDKIKKAQEDYDNYLSTLTDGYEALYGASDAEQALTHAIEETYTQVQALTEAYNEAYTAAYDSITGQYEIWDEAASVSAVSTEKITAALESQNKYWTDYNANLEKLRERGTDIEGLTDVIGTFADGSADSVNAIAGMAAASDEDLAAMVENYNKLQETQKTTAESIADLKTDYTAQMTALTEELKQQIGELEMTDEAYELGMQSVQGYIDGAAAMTDPVRTAYAAIGDAAIEAMRRKLDMHSPSRVFSELAGMTWAGYIEETHRQRDAVAAAMEETAAAGIDAVTASAPVNTGDVNAPITLSISVSGAPGSDAVQEIRTAGNDIVQQVLDALEDRAYDGIRRSYT